MLLTPDDDLLAVASFMQENVPQSKILAVANALPKLAELLWNENTIPENRMLYLQQSIIPAGPKGDDLQKQLSATV